MPTTAVTESTAPGGYSTTGTTLSWTAADTSNQNHIDSANQIAVLFRNVHASTTYTCTITSQADETTGRTGDVAAVNIAAGAQKLFLLQKNGWSDGNSQYLVEGNNVAIEIAWYQRN